MAVDPSHDPRNLGVRHARSDLEAAMRGEFRRDPTRARAVGDDHRDDHGGLGISDRERPNGVADSAPGHAVDAARSAVRGLGSPTEMQDPVRRRSSTDVARQGSGV
ncbi:MAG: hypothetical protein M1606_02320 [Candidatus Thermoplasmatota archaeon]|nr:hypothetical protein [Candidatus Thermoplasmatota archaeon]MCL5983485.1 hypothetical protein [Candidatus Thermoplasmatota archaeon]